MIFNIKCFPIHKYALHHLGVWFTSFDVKVGRGIKQSCDFLRYFTRKTWEVLICSMLFDPNVVTTFVTKTTLVSHIHQVFHTHCLFCHAHPPSLPNTSGTFVTMEIRVLSQASPKFDTNLQVTTLVTNIAHFCHNLS